MERTNTIINYPYQGIGSSLGSPETPSSAISLAFNKNIDEPFYFASDLINMGHDPLKIVGIKGNEISPLSSIFHHFYYTNVRGRSKPSKVIIWQKNLNIILVNTFMGKFVLKYRIDDYKKVYAYLLENEYLTPFIEDSVVKLEEYFVKGKKDMVLKIQSDPEDESNDGNLYLELISSLNIDEMLEIFNKFQREWLIPTLGSKIALFNIILK